MSEISEGGGKPGKPVQSKKMKRRCNNEGVMDKSDGLVSKKEHEKQMRAMKETMEAEYKKESELRMKAEQEAMERNMRDQWRSEAEASLAKERQRMKDEMEAHMAIWKEKMEISLSREAETRANAEIERIREATKEKVTEYDSGKASRGKDLDRETSKGEYRGHELRGQTLREQLIEVENLLRTQVGKMGNEESNAALAEIKQHPCFADYEQWRREEIFGASSPEDVIPAFGTEDLDEELVSFGLWYWEQEQERPPVPTSHEPSPTPPIGNHNDEPPPDVRAGDRGGLETPAGTLAEAKVDDTVEPTLVDPAEISVEELGDAMKQQGVDQEAAKIRSGSKEDMDDTQPGLPARQCTSGDLHSILNRASTGELQDVTPQTSRSGSVASEVIPKVPEMEPADKALKKQKERSKSAHARRERFYRSLSSVNSPPEVRFMAEKARQGSRAEKTSKLQALFEQWCSAEEQWSRSQFVLRMRNSVSSKHRGARRWMPKQDIVKRYGEDVACQIISEKQKPELENVQWKRHPDLPDLKELFLFKCWDEEVEAEERDEVIESLFEGFDTDKKKRKKSKGGEKVEKRMKTSSSSRSSSPSPGSSSSAAKKRKRHKKEKKEKRIKKEPKENRKEKKRRISSSSSASDSEATKAAKAKLERKKRDEDEKSRKKEAEKRARDEEKSKKKEEEKRMRDEEKARKKEQDMAERKALQEKKGKANKARPA